MNTLKPDLFTLLKKRHKDTTVTSGFKKKFNKHELFTFKDKMLIRNFSYFRIFKREENV